MIQTEVADVMPPHLPAIDFRRIRAKPPRGTQADGFEELYSQLLMDGELGAAPEGTRFQRFGNPDGGREGRALLPDGQVWCWQSKYQWSFDSPSDVDESYRRALALEPDMTRYLVGMPIDLPAGDRPGARSAQTKWNQWVADKQAELSDSRTMEFEFHGENAFNLALLRPENVGYLRYWFDRDAFTQSDLQRLLKRARDIAGPRYTEDLNVDVPLADVIRGFTWDRATPNAMQRALAEIRRHSLADFAPNRPEHPGDQFGDRLDQVVSAISTLEDAVTDALTQFSKGIPPNPFDETLEVAANATRALQQEIRTSDDQRVNLADTLLVRNLDALAVAISHIDSEAQSPRWRALGEKALLVTGVGGAGKTHLLIDVVRERIEAGMPALVILGEQFTSGPIEDELARLLGFTGPPDDLLPTLDVAGESSGGVALLVIDGLNESLERSIWTTYLEAFLRSAAAFEHVRVILSCRSEYLVDCVSDRTKGLTLEIEHRGFAHSAQAAVAIFADWYGLDRPVFPLLVPEFTNPLLLKLACEAARDRSIRAFPQMQSGMTWLTDLIVDAVDARLADRARCDYPLVRRLARKLCEWFANRLAEGERAVPLGDMADESERLLPNREWSRSLALGLIREGMLTAFKVGDEEFVRFAYERVGDVLAATSIASLDESDRDEHCRRRAASWYRHAGVLQALSGVLPEKCGIELIDILGHRVPEAAIESFCTSLQWRAASTVSERTVDLLRHVLADARFCNIGWDTLLILAPLDGYPLNAEFLHGELLGKALSDRDAHWTTHTNHDLDGNDVLGRLSAWAWSPISRDTSDEVARLTATALTWALSSSRRKTRDNATKALVALIEHHPSMVASLVGSFADVNDPYVEERLLAACFGAAARRRDEESRAAIADAVAAATVDVDYWPSHLLTRHYARRVFELAASSGWSRSTEMLLNRVRPPYQSTLPEPRLSGVEIESMNGPPDYTYSTVGHSVLSDFGDFRKYVINHPVESFRLPEGVDVQQFAQLVFERVLELGWTPSLFGEYDQRLGRGGDRGERLERIGKKYQWIAYWQLLATLVDNCELVERFSDEVRAYDEPMDVDVPDIDPTLLAHTSHRRGVPQARQTWYAPVSGAMPDSQRDNWVLTDEYVPDPRALMQVRDPEGQPWTLLEGHYSWEQSGPSRESGQERMPRHFVWMQIRSYVVPAEDLQAIAEWAQGQDWYGRWMPETGDPYGLYLADHPNSAKWVEASRVEDSRRDAIPANMEVTTTSYGGMGGSWDFSDSSDVRGLLPASALCDRLSMTWSGDFTWSADGVTTIAANFGVAENGPNAVFVAREPLAAALTDRGEALFVTVLAEKGTYREHYDYVQGTPFSRSYSASFVIESGNLCAIHSVARTRLAGNGETTELVEWNPGSEAPL